MTHAVSDDNAAISPVRKRLRLYLPLWVVFVWMIAVGGGIAGYIHYRHPDVLVQLFERLMVKAPPPPLPVPLAEKPAPEPPAAPEKPASLEDEFSNTAVEASISAVMDRTVQLEQEIGRTNQRLRQAQQQLQVAPLIIAVVHLRDAIIGAAPYVEELAILRSLTPNDVSIQRYIAILDERAGTGVYNISQLKQQFETLSHAVAVAARQAPAAATLWEKIRANLSQMVVIRKVGEAAIAEGNTADATLAIIEKALAKNDLAAAITAGERLDESARAALEPWLQEARASLKAHQTAKALYGYMMTLASGQVKVDNIQVIEEVQ